MPTQTNPQSMDADSTDSADAKTKAQDKAQEATGQAQEKAQQAAGQAHAKVREQLDQRSTRLAGQVHQQASDLRSVSEALRDQGKDRPAEVVDRLAGYGERAGSYLRDKDADAMLGDESTNATLTVMTVVSDPSARLPTGAAYSAAVDVRAISDARRRTPELLDLATTASPHPSP